MELVRKELSGAHPSQVGEENKKGKFKVQVDVPSYGSVSELIELAGSEEHFLKVVNGFILAGLKATVGAYVRSKEAQGLPIDDVVTEIRNLAKTYNFAAIKERKESATKVKVKAKAEAFDKALAFMNDDNLSEAEKAQRIIAALQAARS